MPAPVSSTWISTCPPLGRAPTSTPPRVVYLTALETRLETMRMTRERRRAARASEVGAMRSLIPFEIASSPEHLPHRVQDKG